MAVEFTAHNIRLDDGTHTKPDYGEYSMEAYPWFVSARRILETVSLVTRSISALLT
jgi:hypothetical protein